MTEIPPPADRSPKIRRSVANHRAAQIRGDLAYRKATDPELYENLAAHYQEDGYGLDGYPLDYPQEDKDLPPES